MRGSKVECAPKPEHVPLLNFYLGKNTPERKDYIMERLVVPVEEGLFTVERTSARFRAALR